MNSFSGRRPTGRASRLGRGLLEGLSAIGTALSDGPKLARIEEIDQQIKDLKQERDHLIAELIEPGDLKVSKNYDPNWRKPEPTSSLPRTTSIFDTPSEGRLTKCGGRFTSSRYHDAHPGCPYIDQIHNAHEFTLRD